MYKYLFYKHKWYVYVCVCVCVYGESLLLKYWLND